MKFRTVTLAILLAASAMAQVKKEEVEGITNFAQVETTVACSGAVKATSIPHIQKLGFVAIVNLRQASEKGADVEKEEAAAKEAGLRYIHLPFNGQSPDPAIADRFIEYMSQPGNQPAFIHCAGGGRAAAMWLIKRLVIDHWGTDRAVEEAKALGMTSAALEKFAIDYAASHRK